MFKNNLWISLLVVGLFIPNVYADDGVSSALEKTQTCLRSQNCDSAKTVEGRKAQQQALEAVGGNAANNQALYNIAADIMPILVRQSDGDISKMQSILLKAQADPKSFLDNLPTEIQVKIKKVSLEVEKKQLLK